MDHAAGCLRADDVAAESLIPKGCVLDAPG